MSAAPKTIAEMRAAARAAAQSRKTTATATPTESVFKRLARESPSLIRFEMNPTLVGYANTLRRTMITDVETVAFRAEILEDGSTTDVKITNNSTPMSNEMLAHRISLIPIHVDRPTEWNPDEFTFSIDVSNDSSDPLDVVASDIQVFKQRGAEEEPLPVPSVQFFHPDPVTHDTSL